jgi:ketosteroid isomerase-like protein
LVNQKSNIEKSEEAGMRHITLRAAVAFISFFVGIWISGAGESPGPKVTPPPLPRRDESRPVITTETPNTEDEQEIHELYRQYALAQTRHDARFFERVEADSFILTDSSGSSITRGQAIAAMRTWDKDIKYSTDVLDIRFYGDLAVVNGQMAATYPGSGSSHQWQWLDVIVKRDGRWQILSTTQLND